MATVDPEKKLQSRVLHWLKDDLGYTYIGDLRDIDNTPIKEDLLSANLKKRGYTDDQIKMAIGELVNKAGNQVDSLYQINRSVYSLLRYGRQGTKDAHGHRPTVHYIDCVNPENNDFAVAQEVTVLCANHREHKRPDVMQDYDVNLICVEDGIDSSKEAGKLLISIIAAVAEMERENIRVHTMAGREQKAREGKWNGGFAPYGYRLENGELVIAEDEVEIMPFRIRLERLLTQRTWKNIYLC